MNKLFNSKLINVDDLKDTVMGYYYIIEGLERYLHLRPLSIVEISVCGRVINVNYETWLDGISSEQYLQIDVEGFIGFLNE